MFRGILILLLLVTSSSQAGEVFRWVDEQGGVHYSDQPPPAAARQLQKISSKGNVVEVDKESFGTKLAQQQSPVVLFASDCGPLCDQAREHLRQRGIPFTLKDPSKEPEYGVELKKLVGSLQVPVIVVGKGHQLGFEATSWDSMLDAAGYPKTPLVSPKAP
jgi:glutaredoxin